MIFSPFLHWLSTSWNQLSPATAALWPPICAFLNSSFTTALAGAGLGAAAGAWSAQEIAKRDAAFEAALEDIRNLNSAITFASGIINSLTGLKRQFVVPFDQDHKQLLSSYEAYRALAGTNASQEPFRFNPDLRTLPPPEISTDELSDVLRRNTGNDPAAWLIFQTLREILATVKTVIIQRNQVIEEMRALPDDQSFKVVAMCIGLPLAGGYIDGRYAELMKHLPRVVDDVLGFSRVLVEHLSERAEKIARQFGKKAPKIRSVDFRVGDQLAVFPDMTEFREEVARIRGERFERPASVDGKQTL